MEKNTILILMPLMLTMDLLFKYSKLISAIVPLSTLTRRVDINLIEICWDHLVSRIPSMSIKYDL